MSITLLAALAMVSTNVSTNDTIDRKDWPQVVAAARRANMPTETLYHALTAPVSRSRSQSRSPRSARLCIRRDEIVATKAGMVCRTRSDWASLGVEILTTRG